MLDRAVLRVGAAAAMVGAVIAVIFNILHPRGDEVSAAEEVSLAAEEGFWLFDHYMLAWSLAFALLAFIAIGRSFAREPAASWGRVALIFGIGSTAVLFATVAIDGWALEAAVTEADEATALAVAYVGSGLLLAGIGSFFGLTPILYGVSVLSGDDYPAWLGWTAIVAGAIGLLTATIIFFDGFSSATLNVLFPISSILFTLWIGVMGYMLWQKVSQPAAAATAPAP
ncbi:MAG: hypothetical protein ACRDKB_02770 [Actinomycetota bacterium]